MEKLNFRNVNNEGVVCKAWTVWEKIMCFLILHKVVVTFIISTALFLLLGFRHFSSGKETQTRIYCFGFRRRKEYKCESKKEVTLSVRSPRSGIWLKQQPSIIKYTHAILPSTWCAPCVIVLHTVPNLQYGSYTHREADSLSLGFSYECAGSYFYSFWFSLPPYLYI